MPGVYPSGQEPQQINAEHEEWITVIDQKTMEPRRVRKADYRLMEVRPGGTVAQPKRRPLNEA